MGVAAHHGHARQGGALLGADDVHDALPAIVHLELDDVVLVAVGVESVDLEPGDGIPDPAAAIGGRNVVIGNREVGIDAPGFALGKLETFEGLGRRDLVKKMAIDVEDRCAVIVSAHLVGIPELVVKGLSGHRLSRQRIPKAGYCSGKRAFARSSGAGGKTT